MGQKIHLNENQLRSLIRESVKKAIMNEISSAMIGRAKNKFYQKYGGSLNPGPEAKDFPTDEHGNLLYPKDMKPLADHYKNFDRAYKEAKYDEDMQDPVVRKAQELYDEGIDWEKEIDDTDGGGAFGYVYGEAEDENGEIWKFSGDASFEWEGDWAISEIDEVEFESPDGQTGSIPRP